jgi:hypothetical protein
LKSIINKPEFNQTLTQVTPLVSKQQCQKRTIGFKAGAPEVRLEQGRSQYFDIHHTSDDTLDKADHDELAQNIAA